MDIKKNSTKHKKGAGVDLSTILVLMRWAGFWEPSESSRLVRAIYTIFSWINITIGVSVTVLPCVLFFVDTISPVAIAGSLTLAMSFLRALLTTIRFVWIRDKAKKLVNRMQKQKLSYENDQNRHEEIHKKAGKEAKLLERIVLGIYTFLTFLSLSVPLILTVSQRNDGGVDTNSTTEHKLYLPIICWYPWSTSNIVYYIISFTHQAYAHIITGYQIAFLTIFNLSIIIHVSAQLQVLCAEFKDVRKNEISILTTGKKYQIADVATTDRSTGFRGKEREKNMLAKTIRNNDEWSGPNAQNILQNRDNERDGSRLMVDGRGHQSWEECHDIVSGDEINTNSSEYIINQRLKGCIRQHQEILR
jgi:hypothetical protein